MTTVGKAVVTAVLRRIRSFDPATAQCKMDALTPDCLTAVDHANLR
jgi:hypothetical protein